MISRPGKKYPNFARETAMGVNVKVDGNHIPTSEKEMGLKITRKPKPISPARPESISLESAFYDHIRFVGSDDQPLRLQVAEFADRDGSLDQASAKRLFDHLWMSIKTNKRSNILLDLTGVSVADPLFRTELTYLSGQLRRQGRFVKLLAVEIAGDWETWL